MKTTSKTGSASGHAQTSIVENRDSAHDDRQDHDHDHEGHKHETGVAEYVRLALMGLLVITSLTGWWRPFMNRDWLAFAGTVIGGFPIYREAWENLLKRRMTMELSMTIALLAALAIGQFFVDQSSITGEGLPVEKTEQSKVFAGTVNKNGVLEVSVERVRRDPTFGKIIRAVEQADKWKAPVQRVADRLAAGLVYFALAAAILTFIVTRNLTATIAVIIVAGACGAAAGTPLAILAGIGFSRSDRGYRVGKRNRCCPGNR